MGGVEIDQRLGIPGAGAHQIFGAEAPIHIPDVVVGMGGGEEAGEIDLPVGIVPAPSA